MCDIQITGVNGTTTSPFTISITGTAEDCQDVVVSLKCASFDDKALIPVVNGIWSTSFDSTCPCGTEAEITVVCNTDPSCNASFFGTIPCDCCPTVIVSPKYSKCINGQYTVQLSTQLFIPDGCEPAQVYWDFGNGDIGGSSTFTTSGYHYFSAISSYLPGDYIAKLIFTVPDNCIPFEYPIHLNPCPPLECCPEISFEVSEPECISDNESEVTITTTITIPEGCHDAQISTNFGDGTNGTVYTASAGVTTVNTETHAYQEGGSYSISASVLQPSGCFSPKKIIKIEECEPCNYGFVKFLCLLFRAIFLITASISLFLLIMGICYPSQILFVTAGINLSIALLMLGLIYLFCRKCEFCYWWIYALSIIFFGVGYLLLTYSVSFGNLCCIENFVIGIGLMLLAVYLFITWIRKCKDYSHGCREALLKLFSLFTTVATTLIFSVTFLEGINTSCANINFGTWFLSIEGFFLLIAILCAAGWFNERKKLLPLIILLPFFANSQEGTFENKKFNSFLGYTIHYSSINLDQIKKIDTLNCKLSNHTASLSLIFFIPIHQKIYSEFNLNFGTGFSGKKEFIINSKSVYKRDYLTMVRACLEFGYNFSLNEKNNLPIGAGYSFSRTKLIIENQFYDPLRAFLNSNCLNLSIGYQRIFTSSIFDKRHLTDQKGYLGVKAGYQFQFYQRFKSESAISNPPKVNTSGFQGTIYYLF